MKVPIVEIVFYYDSENKMSSHNEILPLNQAKKSYDGIIIHKTKSIVGSINWH